MLNLERQEDVDPESLRPELAKTPDFKEIRLGEVVVNTLQRCRESRMPQNTRYAVEELLGKVRGRSNGQRDLAPNSGDVGQETTVEAKRGK